MKSFGYGTSTVAETERATDTFAVTREVKERVRGEEEEEVKC